jgi:hypothetical protein
MDFELSLGCKRLSGLDQLIQLIHWNKVPDNEVRAI